MMSSGCHLMKTAILVQVLGIYLVSGQLTSGPNQRDRDPVPSRDDHEKEQVQHNIGGVTITDESTKFVPLEPIENSCRFASLKCSYRTGCGATLQSYLIECSNLIHNKTEDCSEQCKNTLVGLTSTEEGKRLMECNCTDSDCLNTKRQIEVCRDSVLYATQTDTIVSCSEAKWICVSDAECGKALEYYNLLCRPMFRGKRCSSRCKNSLKILQRQAKAVKLSNCQCQGEEYLMDEFKCSDVRRNMIDLCFDPPEVTTPMIEDREILTNEVDVNETVAVKKKSDGTLTVPPALKSVITPSVILALFMSKRYH